MGDWRRTSRCTEDRQKDITGGGIVESGGIFQGLIDSSSGENQTARLVYHGGSTSTPLPMPFESTDSWIRSIPITGTTALVTYRRDTKEATFIRYLNDQPKKKLDTYNAGKNAYKPLLPGEHEIHSSGYAQSYYSQRPILEQRGGVIRSWLDQDRAECGQKAPIHTRQLHSHRTNELGDEERFGVVKRPKELNLANAAYLGSTYSSNFSEYPYPDFSMPSIEKGGGVPAAFSLLAETIATASEAAAALTGTFKIRPFAKEYLRILKNPLSPLPPTSLIDIREGNVFDDDGKQVTGASGAYLRAKHEYFTTLTDSTKCEIDDLGNINWTLSLGASEGWNTNIPAGAWKLDTGLGITMSTLNNIEMSSTLGTTISATTDLALSSTLNTSIDAGLNYACSAGGTYDVTSKLPMTLKTDANFTTEAALIFEAKAGTQMNLNAPIIQIGSSPNEPTVMGTQLVTWLYNLCNLFFTNQAFIGMGNLGAPVPLNPAIVTGIQSLMNQVLASETSPLTSKTITVSP